MQGLLASISLFLCPKDRLLSFQGWKGMEFQFSWVHGSHPTRRCPCPPAPDVGPDYLQPVTKDCFTEGLGPLVSQGAGRSLEASVLSLWPQGEGRLGGKQRWEELVFSDIVGPLNKTKPEDPPILACLGPWANKSPFIVGGCSRWVFCSMASLMPHTPSHHRANELVTSLPM